MDVKLQIVNSLNKGK